MITVLFYVPIHLGYAKFGKVTEAEAVEDNSVETESGREGLFVPCYVILSTRSSAANR